MPPGVREALSVGTPEDVSADTLGEARLRLLRSARMESRFATGWLLEEIGNLHVEPYGEGNECSESGVRRSRLERRHLLDGNAGLLGKSSLAHLLGCPGFGDDSGHVGNDRFCIIHVVGHGAKITQCPAIKSTC